MLATAVMRECPDWTIGRLPAGGLHLWIDLPAGTDSLAITRAARQHNVAINSGNRYFASEPPVACLRLAFAATADEAELIDGARRLGRWG